MTMTTNQPTQFENKPQPDFSATDPYRILGLSPAADQSDIKRTYFALIRQYPPETEGDKFKIIRGAYEKLKDTKRRGETDIFRPKAPPVWEPPSKYHSPIDTAFHAVDALTVLRHWGELGRTDFQADTRDIEL
jgi:curved DNA-binding protein CbpA